MVLSASTTSLNYLQCSVPPAPSGGFMLNFLLVTRSYESALSWQWRTSSKLCLCCLVQSSPIHISKRTNWSINSSTGSSRFNSPPGNSSNGPSRLVKIIKDFQVKLFARVEDIKTEFPMKLLFFLVGFYCATGFATVIGQTGDWDVLAAGLAVIVVEGIGALMTSLVFVPSEQDIKEYAGISSFAALLLFLPSKIQINMVVAGMLSPFFSFTRAHYNTREMQRDIAAMKTEFGSI